MNDIAQLQALREQVLDAYPATAPDPSPAMWAWLHDGAPLAAAVPASPWTRLVRWFAGLGIAVQSLVGTSVALAVVAGAGAAGLLPTPVQDVVDDLTITQVPPPSDAVELEAEDPVPVQVFAPEPVKALVLEPVEDAEDRAEDAADEAEDRADDEADRLEEARDIAEDRAEDEADEAEDRADEAQDRAEDEADDKADADEDAADEAQDRAEDEADEKADRAEDAKEKESGDR